jgi:type 2 lantibiotic biosynthesis protein LanM
MTGGPGAGTVPTVTTRTPTPGGGPAAAVADPAWWAPGLALHERAATAPPAAPTGGAADPALAPLAAALGWADGAVEALLAEPPAALAARTPRPRWAEAAERAVRSARPLAADAPVPAPWRAAFARVLHPFVEQATARVARADVPDGVADLAAVARDTGAALDGSLVDLAVRTLVVELHHRRAEGRLAGPDGAARFGAFVRLLTAPAGLGELLARYPVLARLLAQAAAATADAVAELLHRLAADRAALVAELLDGTDPGPVVGLVTGRGDAHGGGRTVAFVDFADGRRLVYKPRDLTAQARFAEFLAVLDTAVPGLAPRAARCLTRPGYGWSEHVPGAPLADRGAADRFYRRQGALLALLHALRATDVHYENLVAHDDHPVLVDTETLFHPALSTGGSGDPAADALAASVHRTALLPLIAVGEQGAADLSGLGGDRGRSPAAAIGWVDAGTDGMRMVRGAATLDGAANRPRWDGAATDPADHEAALLAGFRLAYDAITARAGEFAALVASCAELPVRVVLLPTWTYRTLLDETTHPDVLRDALDRDRALSVLCAGRAGDPLRSQLVGAELDDLWAGDVPLFHTSAGGTTLRTAAGAALPVPLPRTGVDAALEVVAGLGEVDRRDQEWIVSAALATRRGAPAHPRPPAAARRTGAGPAHPDRLLAAACAVADRIVARGVPAPGRVNWLGLEAVDGRQWLVLPLGSGLGHGHLGVALFLAQLAAVTGLERYADQARLAVAGVPGLVGALRGRPDLVADAGCGGVDGLGGLAYGLARLHLLLDDPALRAAAADAAVLASGAAATATDPGWTGGLAGCLAALGAVHADLGLDAAGDVARLCADRLADGVDTGDLDGDTDGGAGPGPEGAGFADGAAGVAWSLAVHGPHERHRAAGRRLAGHLAAGPADPGTAAPGWCHGAAGAALALACAPGADPAAVAGRLGATTVHGDLSLCHGELGVAEALGVLAASAAPGSGPVRELRRRAGAVLDVLRRQPAVCGTPGGVDTPGLLTGLAGIGHGLLRLAAPREVPSVLLLQPARTSAVATRPLPHRTPTRTPSGSTGSTKENPPCRTS